MNMEKSKITTQLITGLPVTMSLMCVGFHYGWSAPSLPKLLAEDSDIHITSDESSWIVSFFTFGSLFGPFCCRFLVDRYGRKWSINISVIPQLISCILIGVAQNYWWLLVARFIAGLGCGMSYTVAPMYLGEIADSRIRGALVAMLSVMLNTGILITYCVGPWVSRLALACMGGAFPLVIGLMLIWIPESPYYLIMKQQPDRAEKSLVWLRGNGNVSEELKELQANVEFDQKNVGNIKDLLLVPGHRKALIVSLGLTMAQQFSGINAVLAYSTLIFEASGSTLNSSVSVIIIGVVQLLSVMLTTFTVDLAGRRPLLLFSAISSAMFLAGEALYFQLQAVDIDVSAISWLPLTAIIGYIICYSVGFGSLIHVVRSELFACNVKAWSMVVCATTGGVSGMIVSKLYQTVADAFGIHVSFWGFATITVFSSTFIFFMLPETKQRSLQSIQDEFHKKTESKNDMNKSKEVE